MRRPLGKVEQTIGWAALLLLLLASAAILFPFLAALLWAVILSYSTWPIYVRMVRWMRGRRTLAAGVMALALFLSVVTPFTIVGAKLADNVEGFRATVQRWVSQGLPPPPAWLSRAPLLGSRVTQRWQALSDDRAKLAEEARVLIEPASRLLMRMGILVGSGLVHLALSVFMCFFLYRDGNTAAQRLAVVIDRIAGEPGRHLLLLAGETVRGVVYGILGTALLQSLMMWLGLKLSGVPAAGLLMLLAFFLAILPAGLVLVWLPVALWLFSQGANGWGTFMLVWGIGVSSLDNFVKPWLISKGSKMPFLLIFVGVLGGAIAFGFIGVFLGPTVLAVAYRLVDDWSSSSESGGAGESEPGQAGSMVSVQPSASA